MRLFYFDTETCGFHGPIVLIQYAWNNGPVQIHDVWLSSIQETLDLIGEACEADAVVGFNLTFDWFHMIKAWTMFDLLGQKVGYNERPIDHIDLAAECEKEGRDGPCVKPKSALDLLLIARKGKYQTTMDRKDIKIRRVPRLLADPLVSKLAEVIDLPDYLFARKKDSKQRWNIYSCKHPVTGKPDPQFCDIVLKFAPSAALKILAEYVLKVDKQKILHYGDVLPSPTPIEVGWAPFALSVSDSSKGWWGKVGTKKGRAWPGVILDHIFWWKNSTEGRQYAEDDVTYTRMVHEHFDLCLHGDVDSLLACQVGAVRWRGFAIDEDKVTTLLAQQLIKCDAAPRAPNNVFRYIAEVMSEEEKLIFTQKNSTEKVVLEGLTRETCKCSNCITVVGYEEEPLDTKPDPLGLNLSAAMKKPIYSKPDPTCKRCEGHGEIKPDSAIRAKEVLDSRQGYNKATLLKKLLQAGRLHPSASVIGSLSSRMAGRTEVGDGKKSANLNSLGIQHDYEIRSAFPLAFGDLVLCGGDFDAFEVSIAEARYDDPDLRRQLLMCAECEYVHTPDEFRTVDACPSCKGQYRKCKDCKRTFVYNVETGAADKSCVCGHNKSSSGEGTFRKIHALFAMEIYPGKSYDDIVASKGSSVRDMYDDGKRSIFGGVFYGGDENTLKNRVGIDEEIGRKAIDGFKNRYKGVRKAQEGIFDKFCSMRQPNGIGSKVYWEEPADYVESLNGFKRFFTLENQICKALFELSNKPPKPWSELDYRVVRRDRTQKVGGAVRSALLACAFQLQAANMRAATNHEIQATGAIITKALQALIWEVQPPGVFPWFVQPFNVHDELMCPTHPSKVDTVTAIVQSFIQATKQLIPLVKMDWQTNMVNWAEK